MGYDETMKKGEIIAPLWEPYLSSEANRYANLFGVCVSSDSDHVSIYEEESEPEAEAGLLGPKDWANCSWDSFVFDCSSLGQKDPDGGFYTHNPWDACDTRGASALCSDLYDHALGHSPSIAQACAATCAKYQYVHPPRLSPCMWSRR